MCTSVLRQHPPPAMLPVNLRSCGDCARSLPGRARKRGLSAPEKHRLVVFLQQTEGPLPQEHQDAEKSLVFTRFFEASPARCYRGGRRPRKRVTHSTYSQHSSGRGRTEPQIRRRSASLWSCTRMCRRDALRGMRSEKTFGYTPRSARQADMRAQPLRPGPGHCRGPAPWMPRPRASRRPPAWSIPVPGRRLQVARRRMQGPKPLVLQTRLSWVALPQGSCVRRLYRRQSGALQAEQPRQFRPRIRRAHEGFTDEKSADPAVAHQENRGQTTVS